MVGKERPSSSGHQQRPSPYANPTPGRSPAEPSGHPTAPTVTLADAQKILNDLENLSHSVNQLFPALKATNKDTANAPGASRRARSPINDDSGGAPRFSQGAPGTPHTEATPSKTVGATNDAAAAALSALRQQFSKLKAPFHPSNIAQRSENEKKKFNEECMTVLFHLDALEGLEGNLRTQRKMLVQEVQTFQDEVLRANAKRLKAEADKKYNAEEYSAAIKLYTQAINDVEADHRHGSFLCVLYCNRAAAHKELAMYSEGVKDCTTAIQWNSSFSKAYARRARCHAQLSNFTAATRDFIDAIQLDPSNNDLRSELDAALEMAKNHHATSMTIHFLIPTSLHEAISLSITVPETCTVEDAVAQASKLNPVMQGAKLALKGNFLTNTPKAGLKSLGVYHGQVLYAATGSTSCEAIKLFELHKELETLKAPFHPHYVAQRSDSEKRTLYDQCTTILSRLGHLMCVEKELNDIRDAMVKEVRQWQAFSRSGSGTA